MLYYVFAPGRLLGVRGPVPGGLCEHELPDASFPVRKLPAHRPSPQPHVPEVLAGVAYIRREINI